MIRLRLLANCLADPSGIKFRGYEVDVDEERAKPLLATRQWEVVQPPPPAGEESAAGEAEWTGDKAAVAAGRREFRGRKKGI